MIHAAGIARAYAIYWRYLIVFCCGVSAGLVIEGIAVRTLMVAAGMHP
jgi:hypothetical protein